MRDVVGSGAIIELTGTSGVNALVRAAAKLDR
ncbi:MAG: hypothetical protein QOC58_2505 [Mycobacterium sp.]|jgi:hypothetical protein|nr:hypothetical protein [Mycobacterium sp.]